MTRRQQAFVFFGIIISAAFLWFAFRNLNPQEVLATVRTLNPFWLVVAAAVFFASTWVIAWRWQFLLHTETVIPVRRLFGLVSIGYMANNVYPFRSGEALRIFLLKRNEGVPLVRGTTTVVVERVFDGLVMLTFIFIPLLFAESISNEARQIATIATPLFLIALVVFLVFAAQPDLLRKAVLLISRPLPEKLAVLVGRISEGVISGLEGLRSPAHLAGAVVTSYGTWAIGAVVFWLATLPFGFSVTYLDMLLVVGTVNLAGLIPASPGQIGVFEFFAAAVLVSTGIDEANALAYAIVVHLVIWLPVTLLGFGLLVREGLGWQAITRAHEIEQTLSQQETHETDLTGPSIEPPPESSPEPTTQPITKNEVNP